ncbi:MAG TPA: ATP-grasp domain-containing protein [Methanosarcinaceae archaeon]|nr:ATP-grasp domain-containing protein [Methanosarcinaceae archaeon]
MKILLAEYAVGIGMGGTFLLEGKAMLQTIANSFTRLGHDVVYLSLGTTLTNGILVGSNENNFKTVLEREAKQCDAGLVIAPDELLYDLSTIMENNTFNLGCTPESAAICADKVKCTGVLNSAGIPAPEIISQGQDQPEGGYYVVKPRFGCASEDTRICTHFTHREGFIATGYIEGEHLSVSLVCGENPLPLAINKQMIDIHPEYENSEIIYNGNLTPYKTPRQKELYDTAIAASRALSCRGYVGIDIVLADLPYVVDVNPRPTTSLFSINKVMKQEIADLLLKNIFGGLPGSVDISGECIFTKEDLK